jgi:hypothetical protein
MAGYQYDVFISYPRRGGITAWVRQVLEPLLREKLAENLPHGEAVSIFLDTAMEIGSRWPDTLAEAHHRSKLLVPVLSHPFYGSGWCVSEWKNMVAREDAVAQALGGPAPKLIFPIRYNDREDDRLDTDISDSELRAQVKARSYDCVRDFNCLEHPRGDTSTAHDLRRQINRLCEGVLREAILAPPPWKPDWPRLPQVAISGSDRRFPRGM